MPEDNGLPSFDGVDFGLVADKVAEGLKESLVDLLEGASEDIDVFLTRIAQDLVIDARTGAGLKDELVSQLELIGEINRIRAVNAAWDVVGSVILAVADVLSAILR